jgi:hypothetical protein
VLAASCLAQAVSMSAATMALLRASLVFIERYPERRATMRENTI